MKKWIVIILVLVLSTNVYCSTVKKVELYPGYNLENYDFLLNSSMSPLIVAKDGVQYSIVSEHNKYLLGRNLKLIANRLAINSTEKSKKNIKKITFEYELVDNFLSLGVNDKGLDTEKLIEFLSKIVVQVLDVYGLLGHDDMSKLDVKNAINHVISVSVISKSNPAQALNDINSVVIDLVLTELGIGEYKYLVAGTINTLVEYSIRVACGMEKSLGSWLDVVLVSGKIINMLNTITKYNNETYKNQAWGLASKFIYDYVDRYNMVLQEMAWDSNVRENKFILNEIFGGDTEKEKSKCKDYGCNNNPVTFGHVFFYYLLTHGDDESFFNEIVGPVTIDIFGDETILFTAPDIAYKIISKYGATQLKTPGVLFKEQTHQFVSDFNPIYWIDESGFLGSEKYRYQFIGFDMNLISNYISKPAIYSNSGPGLYYEKFENIKNSEHKVSIKNNGISKDENYLYVKNFRVCYDPDSGCKNVIEYGNLAIPHTDHIKIMLSSSTKGLPKAFRKFLIELESYQAIPKSTLNHYIDIKEFLHSPIFVSEAELVYDNYLLLKNKGKIFKKDLENITRDFDWTLDVPDKLTRKQARDDIKSVMESHLKFETFDEYNKTLQGICAIVNIQNAAKKYQNKLNDTFELQEQFIHNTIDCDNLLLKINSKYDGYTPNHQLLRINNIVEKINMDKDEYLTRYQFYKLIYNSQVELLGGLK